MIYAIRNKGTGRLLKLESEVRASGGWDEVLTGLSLFDKDHGRTVFMTLSRDEAEHIITALHEEEAWRYNDARISPDLTKSEFEVVEFEIDSGHNYSDD